MAACQLEDFAAPWTNQIARDTIRVVTSWWLSALAATAGAAVLFVAGGGCSIAFDLDREQCTEASDCSGFANATCQDNVCVALDVSGGGGAGGSGGGAVDPQWACLPGFEAPVPPGDTIQHNYRVEMATGAPGTVPMGLAIEVCNTLDLMCTSPVDTPAPDANGAVLLDLDVAFDGYLRVTSDESMPTIVVLQRPVKFPQEQKVIRVIGQTNFEGLVSAADVTWDMTRGVAVVLTNNCLDMRAAGVRVESSDSDAETVTFHFKGALPDPESTQTDEQGAAGFLNMPVGIAGVDIFRVSTGEYIGSASFRSQPGVISYVPIGPTAAE